VQIVDLPGSNDTVYQRLKRFVQFALPDLLVARFVLAHLRDEQHLLLVLDRTNWKLGQQDINILLLSVRWQTFSFPLVWTLLPHSGNSN
ncbi:IS4 family transposase, partial [Acinetobacter baumannii]